MELLLNQPDSATLGYLWGRSLCKRMKTTLRGMRRHGRALPLLGLVVLVSSFGLFQFKLSADIVPGISSQQETPSWPVTSLPVEVYDDKDITGNDGNLSTVGNQNMAELSNPIMHVNVTFEHAVLLFRKGLISHLPSPIPVVLWPYMDAALKKSKRTSADVLHIEVNGVEESSILTMANDSVRTLDPNVVWVTDAKFLYSQWCTRLAEKAVKIQKWRRSLEYPPSWPVYVLDFTDPPHFPKRCTALEEVIGLSHVLYFKRSIVTNRMWDVTTSWLHLGSPLLPPSSLDQTNNITFEQTPLIVRSDIVQGLAEYQALHNSYSSLINLPHRLRSMDVAHHWPPSTEMAQFSNLRNRVSTWLVNELGKDYRVHCDTIGQHDRVGRRQAQRGYVESIADTKILVVAQRDTYEDHYRLWEALASGALVVTDPMLTLPGSLQNGTHLLIYHSLAEMISLVRYYLGHSEERIRIAEAGLRAAMGGHRSWHRMEEIILGRPVTTCGILPYEIEGGSECPFSVHANEWLSNNTRIE